jgi:hypothetical protein
MVHSGALGTLHRAVWVCNSWYRTPAYHRSAPWRSSWNGECGGLMINQNPHYLDMWNWFFGLPDKVYAALEFGRYNDFQVDDAADVQFYYNSGFHGTMVSATGEAPGVNRLEIWGSKGKLTVEDGTKLTFDENEVSTETFAVTNQEIFTALPHKSREIPLDAAGIPYQQVLSRFAAAVLKDAAPVADGMDGLREVQLANAIYSRLPKYTGLRGRGLKSENWYVINQNSIPAVLVEGGFMDSNIDHKVITSDAGQTAYAKAVAEGLIEFLGLKKKAPSITNTNVFKPYLVRVKVSALNIRKTPKWSDSDVVGVIRDKGTYTIVGETTLEGTKFGKLKSGAGWISVESDYVTKV